MSKSALSPPYVIQVNLRMISQAPLVGPSAVVVLHTIRVEGLYFAIIFCDNQLHKHLALWCQQKPLQLFWVFQLTKGL